jgi:hypothetical protein
VISVVAAAIAASAAAATPTVATDTSTNWAGYTLTDTATAPVSFTPVYGTRLPDLSMPRPVAFRGAAALMFHNEG